MFTCHRNLENAFCPESNFSLLILICMIFIHVKLIVAMCKLYTMYMTLIKHYFVQKDFYITVSKNIYVFVTSLVIIGIIPALK